MMNQPASSDASCKRSNGEDVADTHSIQEDTHPPLKKAKMEASEVESEQLASVMSSSKGVDVGKIMDTQSIQKGTQPTLENVATDSREVELVISLAGGTSYKVLVSMSNTVQVLREAVERQHEVPPACRLKLFQAGHILVDSVPINELVIEDQVFAVVARETNLEILLQAAGTYSGYKKLLGSSSSDPADSNIKVVGPLPSILSVLEDMAGQAPDVKNLRAGSKEGTLEFSGANGALLLPSLDPTPLLVAARVDKFKKVVISVELNSDSYNRGLGVVLEASPLMDVTIDESGLPSYVYNGLGISDGKRRNVVKFHPGMHRGQLRVEGKGGFYNSGMSFTPLNWTESGNKYHTFEISVGTDGKNEIQVKGTKEGELWHKSWNQQLTSGKEIPAIYAWLDLGGCPGQPLQVGQIHVYVHL